MAWSGPQLHLAAAETYDRSPSISSGKTRAAHQRQISLDPGPTSREHSLSKHPLLLRAAVLAPRLKLECLVQLLCSRRCRQIS